MNKWLQAALVGGSLGVLALFVYTFSLRVGYGYDLEWMEGGMLIHGLRVMNGEGLYVEPTSDFIPFIYPPLYSWLLGLGGHLFGLDYPMGRSISFIGSVATLAAIVTSLRIEKLNWGLAAFGAALFLSSYENSGTFLDLVRADSLLIALIGWSLVFTRSNKPIVAGLLLFLAFLTKHNAALFGLPCLWWIWSHKGKRSAILFTVASAGPALLSIAILQYQTDGFFLTYLLGVPAGHPFVGHRFIWGAPSEMINAMPILVCLLLIAIAKRSFSHPKKAFKSIAIGVFLLLILALLFRNEAITAINGLNWKDTALEGMKQIGESIWGGLVALLLAVIAGIAFLRIKDEGHRFWVMITLVALLASMIMRGHHGGYLNVLIPGCYALAISSTLAAQRVMSSFGKKAKLKGIVPIIIATIALMQLWQGRWNVEKITPTEADVEAGDRMIARLSKLKGPIFAPHSPWYPVKAGHPPTLHLIALWDIDHPTGPLKEGVKNIERDIANHRWHAILIGANRKNEWKRRDTLNFGVKKHYERRQMMRSKGKALLPKTGWRVRPVFIRSKKTSRK